MNAKYYFATLMLAAGGVAIGSYVLPQQGELAMIYYRSGRLAEARRILEIEMRDGDLSASDVYYATQTYIRLGDLEHAIGLVEQFVDAHPNDLTARRILGKFYNEAGKVSLYTHNLEAIERLAPAAAQRLELFQLYRLQGNNSAWAAMLERVVPENIANPEDYLTLAKLYAARGDRERALGILKLLIERHAKSADAAVDELRISLELDAGRLDRAMAAAEAGIRRRPGLATVMIFADMFQQRGQQALAMQLLEPFAELGAGDAAFMRALISLEIAQGKSARALARLEALDRAGKLAGPDRNLIISAALATGNWEAAMAAFQRIAFADLSQPSIEQMARAAIARNDQDAIRIISSRLSEEFRAAFPVTAAEIALVLGERQSALRWAEEAFRRERPPDNERIGLAMIYVRLDNRDRARSLLAALSREGSVPEHLALDLAVLHIKLDLAADGFALFEKLAKARPASRLRAARTLLDAQLRPTARDWDLSWIEAPAQAPAGEGDIATAAYWAAMDVQSHALAAMIGRHVFDTAPSNEARLRYARALALAGDAQTAVEIVRPLLETSADARAVYAIALVAALKAGTAREDEVRAFVARQLTDSALSVAEKKAIIGDLIAAKAFGIVLPLLEELLRRGERDYVESYMWALTSVRDKKQLRALLRREMQQATDSAKLQILAKVAFQESLLDLARPAYSRILKEEPKNLEALKRLGQMALWSSEPDSATARRYFEAFIAAGGDDYQIDYQLGEAIIQFPDWQRATPHYQRALAKVVKLPTPTLEDRMLRAKLLYRLGRFDDSVAAYEDLVRRFPRDRALRDEFHDVLVDMGRYDRARTLRGGRAER